VSILTIKKNSSKAIYIQLKDQLKAYIKKNKLKEGDKLPDLKTIAEQAEVSLRTAYLGAEELIKEKVCFKRPKNGIFVAQKEGQTTRALCGIYDSRFISSYEGNIDTVQGAIFKGISQGSDKSLLETFFIASDAEQTIEFYKRINELDLKGIFMLRWNDLAEGIRLAEKHPDLKFIYLNYQLKNFEQTPDNIYGIFNDDFGGAYQMCCNLINRGCKDIKIFTFDMPDENYKRRTEGALAALKDNGLDASPDCVFSDAAKGKRSLQEIGQTLAEQLRASKKQTDAVFCVNDLLAEGAVTRLKEKNKQNTEVTGYDNILSYISLNNGFSTVAINFEQMGLKAVDLIKGNMKHPPKTIHIQPQVIERVLVKK
jgi:DNA-binding LacI/PurR family transcriptional regulator